MVGYGGSTMAEGRDVSLAAQGGLLALLDRQPAFYRQIAAADQAYTDEIEPRYPDIELPVLVV